MFNIQKFENLARENGVRYWNARDFMVELGYDTWSSFSQVINRSMASCAQLGIDITEVFIPLNYEEDGRSIQSFKLTRFACLLVTMHADSKKPQVSQAKVALAGIADALISQRIDSHLLERIEIRDELKQGESIMSGAAKAAGLQNHEYGIFKDAGIRGMYNMSLTQLVSHKGGPAGKVLYDFMGKTELAANLFRVTQTAERISNQGVKGLPGVTKTAHSVGAEVRGVMLRSSGVAPEHLPLEEDISKVKSRLKSTQKQMHKLDNNPQAKRKQKPE
jgi:DNA-damage-inducible protein D